MKKLFLILLLGISVVLIIMNCDDNPTEPEQTYGTITGTVKNLNSATIHPAYIFFEDSLLATTDTNGNYSISSIDEGAYQLTCSALNYGDLTEQVTVLGGKTVTHDFNLTPNSAPGKVYGEFQDVTLYKQSLQTNPSLAQWDAKKIFDDITGATLQAKTLQYEVPDRKVLLGDSLLEIADVWGQYWFRIQCGTYPIKASCEGYHDTTQVIKVLPDQNIYVNFFLRRK